MSSWAFMNWICDFCGRPMLTVSAAGIIYCINCSMSYGCDIPSQMRNAL